jgi:DNA polymerase I-like protein with 3'-5' exonuclease and polymerase domains
MQSPPVAPLYPRSLFARLAGRCIVPGEAPATSGKLRVAFDIETDALLDKATVVHCIVIAELDGDAVYEYGPTQIEDGLAHLARVDYLVGHNILGFDLAVLQKLHGWAPAADCKLVDTLVVSRLVLPHLGDLDKEVTARTGTPSLGGSHSAEAWGVRLGYLKVGGDLNDFSKWSPELQERCVADTKITKAMWCFLKPDNYSARALELEHRVAPICDRIAADGVPFDRNAAEKRRQQWTARRAEREQQLGQQFPGTNFNSRKQIGALLEARGWIPEQRTKKTKQPKISDEVLETLPATFPEFAGLAEYAILGRRLGALHQGPKAWLKHIGADQRIHGGLVSLGTPHSRAKHFNPNLAQVPNPKRGKPFATECRQLFRLHDDNWVFVAADQSLLQDRGLAHYLHKFDGGAYGQAFLTGTDTHWQSAITLGLVPEGTARDKNNRVHSAIREGAKSFRYAFLYGVGAAKAGRIIYDTGRTTQQLSNHSDLHRRFFGDAMRPNEALLKRVGRQAIKRFEIGTPGLRQLRERLQAYAQQRKWLPGLDGRRVPVRAVHTALNFLITSSEAIICKRWLVRVYDELCARFRYGWDGDVVIVLWVHDELVACARKEIAAEVGELMVRHAKEPADFYSFKIPLDAEYKIGNSWAGDAPPALAPEYESSTTESSLADLVETEIVGGDIEYDDGDYDDDGDDVEPDIPADPNAIVGLVAEIPELVAEVIEANDVGAIIRQMRATIRNVRSTPRAEVVPADKTYVSGKILCPFHDDHTPSLEIYANESDPHFHCFVCDAHGHLDDLKIDWSTSALQVTAASLADAAGLARAHELWDHGKPIAGTLAEQYLGEVRGIDVSKLPANVDEILRFHPRCPFGRGNRVPCLLALYRDVETDRPAGIHRIALPPDVFAGANVERLTLGRWARTRAIKLWPADKQLFVGEGLETVLAAATRLQWHDAPMQPAWAVGRGGLCKLPVIASIDRLVILVDNDLNGAGQAAAMRCADRWGRDGRQVVKLTPKRADTDFNDIANKTAP